MMRSMHENLNQTHNVLALTACANAQIVVIVFWSSTNDTEHLRRNGHS